MPPIPPLAASIRAGKVVETEHLDTLADGCAGGVDDDTLTLPLAMRSLMILSIATKQKLLCAEYPCLGRMYDRGRCRCAGLRGYVRRKEDLKGKPQSYCFVGLILIKPNCNLFFKGAEFHSCDVQILNFS